VTTSTQILLSVATLEELRDKDGRNVAVTALRKRLAFVQGLIHRCNVRLDPPAPPRSPDPGPILYKADQESRDGRAKLPLLRAHILGPN
jgi:hypothetical protein